MLFSMPKTLHVTALLFFCAVSACIASAADDAHFPSNEDLRHVRAMAQPRLSPDGRSVLIQITDSTADGAKTHLWLVDIRQNTSRQLTWSTPQEKRGEYSGRWMPDGSAILFLAHRGDHTQLYRLPMEAGEARPYDRRSRRRSTLPLWPTPSLRARMPRLRKPNPSRLTSRTTTSHPMER